MRLNGPVTPAEAQVKDLGRLYDGGGEHWWEVVVQTPPGWPRFARRIYTFKAYTDYQAGQMGLQQFGEDVDGRQQIPIWMG